MIKITTCTPPAKKIAYLDCGDRARLSDPAAGERRIAWRQPRQLRDELGIRDKFDRIETEQRYFAEVEIYAGTIEPDGFELPF